MKYPRTRSWLVLLTCWFFGVAALLSAEPGQVRWTYSAGLTNYTDLALGPDGTIYLGRSEANIVSVPMSGGGTFVMTLVTNHLFALTEEGQDKWGVAKTGHRLAIRSDGKILSLAGWPASLVDGLQPSGFLYSTNPPGFFVLSGVNPDGSSWLADYRGHPVAVTADDDVIVPRVNAAAGSPYAEGLARRTLGSTNLGWTNAAVQFYFGETGPVILPNGDIAITSHSSFRPIYLPSGGSGPPSNFANTLHVVGPDGNRKFDLFETNVNYSTPAIGWDGIMFLPSGKITVAGFDYTVQWSFRAIGGDATFLWSVSKPDQFGPAVVDRTNNVYTGSGTKLYSFTANGIERWVYEADSAIDLCPALAADGTIYAVTRGGKLLALDTADGSLRWSYESGRPIHFPPTIGADGTVYLLVDNSDLVAIEGSAPPADAPWPQDRHDAQRTSRATQASTSGLTRNEEGKFSLMLNLEPGRAYQVEASEDLQTWIEIGSFTSSSAARTFLDETSVGKSKRFYRLVMP